jgi:hypothetical protein
MSDLLTHWAVFDAWLDNLFAKVQPLYLDIELYGRVYEHPDPARMRAYGVETAFYREDDPAVRVARAAQAGQTVRPEELHAALAPGANRGGYGQALELGMQRLRDASRFWRGETDATPDLRQ